MEEPNESEGMYKNENENSSDNSSANSSDEEELINTPRNKESKDVNMDKDEETFIPDEELELALALSMSLEKSLGAAHQLKQQ